MVITSLEFLVFIAIALLLYKIMPGHKKWTVLLIASYLFYFLNSTYLTAFLIITTLSIYFVALSLSKINEETKSALKNIEDKEQKKILKKKSKSKQKLILALGIILNIAILTILKYSGVIGENINSLFSILKIPVQMPIAKFILPLGISYYTLQAISYMVDVYRGKIQADKNIGRVALFLSFFPQMVEGPIGRYDKLANQLYEPHSITYNQLTNGGILMLWGYFKKMVIADRIGMYANQVFGNYSEYSGIIIILGIISYTIQIYAEFSGGIDIVRGVSEIFGIHLDENFERPFFSKSIDEFWRRWHITLGTWMKDYVFYPVSLSKLSMKITDISKKIFKTSYLSKIIPVAFSLLCVWLCNGIWHGSGVKYIIYGLYYYSIMMLGKILEPFGNKLINIFKINTKVCSYRFWQVLKTSGFVCIGMTIFRTENLSVAIKMVKSIFHQRNLEMIFNGEAFLLGVLKKGDIAILIISMVILLIVSLSQEKKQSVRKWLREQNLIFRWIVYYGLIFSIIIFGIYGQGYNVQSFIYGQF